MSKSKPTDNWDLMNLIDKELKEAIGIESADWKYRNSPSGMINTAIRERKPDVFHYLREAVAHTLMVKALSLPDSESTQFIKRGIHNYSVFVNENANVKKFLNE